MGSRYGAVLHGRFLFMFSTWGCVSVWAEQLGIPWCVCHCIVVYKSVGGCLIFT